MDNKEKDFDEIKIDALFNQIKTPKYDLMEGITQNMNKKQYKSPRFSVAAACITLVVFLTAGMVYAYSTGVFQRLLGIVGEEHANTLTPIEVEVETTTAPFIPGYNQTSDDLRIEIVAINLSEYNEYIDFYVTLEDLSENRINDTFSHLSYVLHTSNDALFYDNFVDLGNTMGIFTADNVINNQDGILTLHTRHFIGNDDVIVDDKITVTFLSLIYNNTGYIDDHPVAIDLSTIPVNPPLQRIDFTESPIGVVPKCPTENVYFAYILEPHKQDLPVGIEGIHTIISNIALVDGNLHIQTYQPRPTYSTFSVLQLRRNGSEQMQAAEPEFDDNLTAEENRALLIEHWERRQQTTLHFNNALMFNLDKNGGAYQYTYAREAKFPTFAGFFSDNQFQEYVWNNVGDTLDELSLIGTFFHSDSIWLDWTVSFGVGE